MCHNYIISITNVLLFTHVAGLCWIWYIANWKKYSYLLRPMCLCLRNNKSESKASLHMYNININTNASYIETVAKKRPISGITRFHPKYTDIWTQSSFQTYFIGPRFCYYVYLTSPRVNYNSVWFVSAYLAENPNNSCAMFNALL